MSSCDTTIYPVEFQVNGEKRTIRVRAADILLYTIRDKLGLTGSKSGCDNGDCGTCTILVDSLPMKSCLMLTVEADGKKITTIEGLMNSPVQHAFVQHQAFQCGYCTPGFIVNCQGLRNVHPHANEDTIRVWLESNICRCMSYEEIHNAVKDVFMKKEDGEAFSSRS
ncbi:(2Fe-2S)-binding protein [Paenibacillus profundus]|uniref:(2Fe-2S)-binding protein n=1 Tax=Paenibacillus profundus TaxID=1173085 RepID=A0ABS8YPT5_9BACL|nr:MULTISPECIES: (2Fe-2S)-binding protein [Paenibacillus]MCE5172327.1 (2Fe-2S)-binding protein [Paenibacillus profundus]MCM3337809.1 (2Fe-2S)-binding protein [Paenibacillus sp. MER TA 81-3]